METNTSNFLLPLLGKTIDYYKSYVVECFLKIENSDIQPYEIYVVVTGYRTVHFENFLKTLREFTSYRGEFYLHGGEYTILLFEIPDKFKLEYDLFLQGKYSKFSEEAKALIIPGRKQGNCIADILNKGIKLRKTWEEMLHMNIPSYCELWSKYDLEKETFREIDFPSKFSKNNFSPSEEFNL